MGLILSVILFLAAGQNTTVQGVYLLLVYGLGMTVPFIIAAMFFGGFMRCLEKFWQHLGRIEKVTGGALVLSGLLIATNTINLVANWMSAGQSWLKSVG